VNHDNSSQADNASLNSLLTTIRKLEVGAKKYAHTAPDIPCFRLAQFYFLLRCHKSGFVQNLFILRQLVLWSQQAIAHLARLMAWIFEGA
jgi:hypothetical protein